MDYGKKGKNGMAVEWHGGIIRGFTD